MTAGEVQAFLDGLPPDKKTDDALGDPVGRNLSYGFRATGTLAP